MSVPIYGWPTVEEKRRLSRALLAAGCPSGSTSCTTKVSGSRFVRVCCQQSRRREARAIVATTAYLLETQEMAQSVLSNPITGSRKMGLVNAHGGCTIGIQGQAGSPGARCNRFQPHSDVRNSRASHRQNETGGTGAVIALWRGWLSNEHTTSSPQRTAKGNTNQGHPIVKWLSLRWSRLAQPGIFLSKPVQNFFARHA